MTAFILMLAHPAEVADCLPDLLVPIARNPAWVAYLTNGRVPLSDMNDDPDLEEEYDAGLGQWVNCVPRLIRSLARQSDARLVQATASPLRTGGRDATWTVEVDPATIDPDFVEGLTTYGNIAVLWTSVPSNFHAAGAVLEYRGGIPDDLRPGILRWWVAHGYKEPFLVGSTPELDLPDLLRLFQGDLDLPIRTSVEPFVPHRVRQQRAFLRH